MPQARPPGAAILSIRRHLLTFVTGFWPTEQEPCHRPVAATWLRSQFPLGVSWQDLLGVLHPAQQQWRLFRQTRLRPLEEHDRQDQLAVRIRPHVFRHPQPQGSGDHSRGAKYRNFKLRFSDPVSHLPSNRRTEVSFPVVLFCRGVSCRDVLIRVRHRISPKSPSPGSRRHPSRTRSKAETPKLPASPSASAPKSTVSTTLRQSKQSP